MRFKSMAVISLMVGLGLSKANAGKPLVAEAPTNDFGTPTTVSVSSSTLTKVPATQTTGRVGFWLDSPSTNTGNLVGQQGNCTSAPAASTIRPIEISPSANTAFYPLSDQQCLWLITTNTGAAENVHTEDIKQ